MMILMVTANINKEVQYISITKYDCFFPRLFSHVKSSYFTGIAMHSINLNL
jgi:hypothetical protein